VSESRFVGVGRHTGIRAIHRRGCPAREHRDAKCRCRPTWEASAFDARADRKLRRNFPTEAAARTWRAETETLLRRGSAATPVSTTIREAAAELVQGMRSGAIRNRSGDTYKPSVIRGYELALDDVILHEFGALKLGELRRGDVRRLVERLQGRDLSPSRIRNVLMPLRVVYRRAVDLELVASSPLDRLPLPAVRGQRDRIVPAAEAAELVAALQPADRAPWALAFYAGLRLGELRAIAWPDLDLTSGELHVRRSWCNVSRRMVAPKSRHGERSVPIAGGLKAILLEHRLLTRRLDCELVVASRNGTPIETKTIMRRAAKTWVADREAAELEPLAGITLHEARHTYASLMIAAGVGAKELSEFMGHSSITVTIDRYGHLFPGSRQQAARMLDAYLAEADA
jgi:integrase